MEPAGAEQHRRKPARVSFREKVNQSNQPVEHKPCRPPNPSVVSRRGAGNGTQDRFTVENLSRIRREKTQIRTSLTLANVLTMF